MEQFEIPVALFIFKRVDKSTIIIDQIAKVKPRKVYLIADGPRNESEREAVEKCREAVESHINWDCEIVKNYASTNRGVYENIAGGANWVFEREECAIFLEDDNFPALSFFQYCKDLLEKYKDDTRVLWICGTNYLQEYTPEDGSDYVFTKLMLPCGWASWSNKFRRFYDGELELYRNEHVRHRVKKEYDNKLLYKHDYPAWDRIISNIDKGFKPSSWDYQMAFALRVNNLYGIAPKYNLIRNIGADVDSIHGGTSMSNIMTKRFCEVPTLELSFPLKHPKSLMVDLTFEQKTENTIILPLRYRFKGKVVRFVKFLLGLNQQESLSKKLRLKK